MDERPDDKSPAYPDPVEPQGSASYGPFHRNPIPRALLPLNDRDRDGRHQQAPPTPSSSYEHARRPYSLIEERSQTLGDILREATTANQALEQTPQVHSSVQRSPGGDFEQDSARKRSKVSRACDECRRKKVRCDVGFDPEAEPCSHCRRSGGSCQFSRQPQKRGPSKGYIKDLSERLNALEHQQAQQYLQHGDGQASHALSTNALQVLSSINSVRAFSPLQPGPDMASRKRTHSLGHHDVPRLAPQSSQEGHGRHLPLPMPSRGYPTLPPAANLLNGSQLLAGSASGNGLQHTSSMPDGSARAFDSPRDTEIARGSNSNPGGSIPEWDEEVVDEYFRLIHQTFPLLPHSKSRLRYRLGSVSSSLREAFFAALDVTIRTNPATNLAGCLDYRRQTKRTAELLAVSQYEDATTSSLTHSLVYIQTLILMALQADNYGPATLKGLLGPPRAEWLGRAIGAAGNLKLNSIQSSEKLGEGVPDTDERLGRRIWWILFILDRWHSSSTSTLLQVPENSSSLEAEDQIMFGDGMYHLARLSAILGHLTHILQQPGLMAADSKAAPILTLTIVGEMDRFKESVESLLLGAPTLVHLSYWHVRLMVLRLTSSTTPHELLAPATKLASVLNSVSTVITPLNHHFAALCALTLVELCGFSETQTQARKGIEDIAAALGGRRGLMGREDSAGWDGAIRALVTKKRAQFDADSAVGSPGAGGAGSGNRLYDPTKLTGSGYLAALVQEDT